MMQTKNGLVYKNTDVHLVSLPANIKNLEDRSLISLYHDMPINGVLDLAGFVKMLKENDSATIMASVYNATDDIYEKWQTALGG